MWPTINPFLGLFIHIANLSSKKVMPFYSPFYLCIIQKNTYFVPTLC